MPINLEITTASGSNRCLADKSSGIPARVGPMTFYVSLHKDGTWTCRRPIPQQWRYVIPEYASGFWYKDIAGFFVMKDHKKKQEVFELRSIEKGSGPAFHWLKGNMYEGTGSWKPSPLPSQKMWAGVLVKGGGGLIVGAEGGAAAVVNVDQTKSGAVLGFGTLRAGIVGGASGGVALVICTGFGSVQEMNGFTSSGADFALAIGVKFSGFLKASKAASSLKKFEGGLDAIEKAIHLGKDSEALKKVLSEVPGAAKSAAAVCSVVVDTDEKNIVAIDIPMAGAGAEIGVFYGWSKVKVVSTW